MFSLRGGIETNKSGDVKDRKGKGERRLKGEREGGGNRERLESKDGRKEGKEGKVEDCVGVVEEGKAAWKIIIKNNIKG